MQPVFVVGDAALPKPILDVFQRGAQSRQPLIIGSNSDDASVVRTFGVDPAAVMQRLGAARILVKPLYPGIDDSAELGRQTMRDVVFTVFSRRIAWLHSRHAPAWWYHFDYVPVNLRSQQPGASHGGEIGFALGTGPECDCTGEPFVDTDREMARRVADYWFAFARGGKPSPAGRTAWPQYHANNDKMMEFGNTIAVRTNFMKSRLRALTGVLVIAAKTLGRSG